MEDETNHMKLLVYGISLICTLWLVAACGKTGPAAIPKISGKPWHLVVLGDSESWGFGQYYAAAIEADQGVKVELNDLWRARLTTSQLLDDLRNFDIYRKAIQEAEVITFIANPLDFTGEGIIWGEEYDCSEKAMAGYKADLDAAITEIFALRKGKPTLIRSMDFYNPIYSMWKEKGVYEENKRCWKAMSATIHQVMVEHNIPVAEVYAAFNGPNYDEDPIDKGYIQSDEEHPSEAGMKVIADAFRKLGYTPIIP